MLLGALRLTAVDENELTDRARGNSATWRTGRSTSYGKSLSADSWTTSNATVTPAFRSPTTQTMATLLAPGSCSNASTTTAAPLSLIASADSRSCPAGHGRHRHPPSGPAMGRPLRGQRPESWPDDAQPHRNAGKNISLFPTSWPDTPTWRRRWDYPPTLRQPRSSWHTSGAGRAPGNFTVTRPSVPA